MGGKHSKSDSLSRTDLDWLIRHTKYNEETIQEWYKGFRSGDPPSCVLQLTLSHFQQNVYFLNLDSDADTLALLDYV